MSSMPTGIAFHKRVAVTALTLMLWFVALTSFGQTQQSTDVRELPSNQTFQREMTGAETHRYNFDLKANEFFQVRVEQKGVDVSLKLLDADGKTLATMDSPNGKAGPETLSFVSGKAGSFILEVSGFDAKAERGIYIIKRAASREATADDKQRVAIEKLFVEGIQAREIKDQTDTAIKKLNEALAGWDELKDDYLKDLTAQQITAIQIAATFGDLYEESAKARKDLKEAQELMSKPRAHALSAREKAKEALSEFRALSSKLVDKTIIEKIISLKNEDLSNALKELQLLTKVDETTALSAIAQTHYNLGEWQAKVDYSKQIISINQELLADEFFRNSPRLNGNYFLLKVDQANQFVATGQMLDTLGQLDEAIGFFNQALQNYRSLFQETQNPNFNLDKALFNFKLQEALVLMQMGSAYGRNSKDRAKAIEFTSKAVEIYKGFADQKRESANGLLVIGNLYALDMNYDATLKTVNESLKYFEEINDKSGQVKALGLMGVFYFWLNNKTKANEIFNRIIEISQTPDFNENDKKNRFSNLQSGFWEERIEDFIERERLIIIAEAYKFLENFQKSNEYYEKALLIARSNREDKSIRTTLGSIAFNYASLKQWNKAAEYYQQALQISRSGDVKEDIASDLQDVGWTLLESGKPSEALPYQNEALINYQLVGVDANQAFTPVYSSLLNEISRSYYALGNKSLAIFYGKRAVNSMQGERQRLQNLEAIAQKGFLERKEKHYRRLADWLIGAGRFAEAEQVLRMLKEEEYFDFVRRDPDEIKNLNRLLKFEGNDKEIIDRYNRLATRVSEIGEEYFRLDEKQRQLKRNKLPLPNEELKRYEALSAQLKDANAAFKLFLDTVLVSELGHEKKKDIEVDRSLQDNLRKWGEGTVALYTVVGEDRYRVILTTPTVQIDGKYEITAAVLNEKIFAFRDALQNPDVDPRPLGQELYDILIKPIEKDLQAVNAKTLIWSLDGTLRYIPLAALSPDGKSYLVEKYQNVIITPQTSREISSSSAVWRALGLGVSQNESITNPDNPTEKIKFPSLPGAKSELMSIVKDEDSQGETGILSGKRFLDEGFTVQNFIDSLKDETKDGKRKYTVIHIASHFHLGSNWTNSFLLLGNGKILSLQDISNSPDISFGDVELITLSACKTAFAAQTNGKEVDSLAEAVQTRSGKAVLATLWSVADASTSLLMSEFYRLRKEKPQLTKAGALQRAQQEMLTGKLKAAEKSGRRDTGEAIAEAAPDYSHPYYWSPFILIGNWR